MTNKKIAVISAQGMGDSLIMHMASHNLQQLGYQVVTFSSHLKHFGKWLSPQSFAKPPSPDFSFQDFDLVILQHDNSPRSKKIKETHPKVYGFYGSHQIKKHGPLSPLDYVCNPQLPMVRNLSLALTKWFGISSCENGLSPPPGLLHKKYPKRVAIHPGSSDPYRNWPLNRYKKVAAFLEQKGYDPVFCDKLSSLEELASFIYESSFFIGNDSGPGHLASYLQIPSLIIGTSHSHLLLWRPGWLPARVITPPRWVSYFKWTQKRWKSFIPTRIIINAINDYTI